ncbi:MAG: hypothetical protein CMI60_21500 [Parvibaculum sp.]|nr:hypothetical protein [Parvibaculum sp.]|tara:strand:- start:71 stop:460 length:390 start_codon:yes stop_codon:yes gene_type:complete
MRTETKAELRQRLKNALSENGKLKETIRETQNLSLPEQFELSSAQVGALLDLIEHAHSSLRYDSEVHEGKQGELAYYSVSEDALRAIYQSESRLADLRKTVKKQCRSSYQWNSMLQTHEVIVKSPNHTG